MSDWISASILVESAALQAANRLAYIIDPDTGGASTFTDRFAFSVTGEPPPTHVGTQTMINPDYVGLMQTGDAELILGALSQLATAYGREPPTLEDCEAFAAGVQIFPGADLGAVVASLGLQQVTP